MPIYEYACDACDHRFEEWQRVSEPPIEQCPRCAARKVRKLVSLSSFALRGSGWYVTDYKNKGKAGKESNA